jgi:hypothetical protein
MCTLNHSQLRMLHNEILKADATKTWTVIKAFIKLIKMKVNV